MLIPRACQVCSDVTGTSSRRRLCPHFQSRRRCNKATTWTMTNGQALRLGNSCHLPASLMLQSCQLPRRGILFFLMVAIAIMHCTAFSSGQVGPPDTPQACDHGSAVRMPGVRGRAPLASHWPPGSVGVHERDVRWTRANPTHPFARVMPGVRAFGRDGSSAYGRALAFFSHEFRHIRQMAARHQRIVSAPVTQQGSLSWASWKVAMPDKRQQEHESN